MKDKILKKDKIDRTEKHAEWGNSVPKEMSEFLFICES